MEAFPQQSRVLYQSLAFPQRGQPARLASAALSAAAQCSPAWAISPMAGLLQVS